MDQAWKQDVVMDRRSKPRMRCDFPVIIKGLDPSGKKFEESGRLRNLSANGLYMVTNRSVKLGDELSVNITLLNHSPENCQHLATVGVVLRTETVAEGTFGVAMSILHYRFQ